MPWVWTKAIRLNSTTIHLLELRDLRRRKFGLGAISCVPRAAQFKSLGELANVRACSKWTRTIYMLSGISNDTLDDSKGRKHA